MGGVGGVSVICAWSLYLWLIGGATSMDGPEARAPTSSEATTVQTSEQKASVIDPLEPSPGYGESDVGNPGNWH